MTTTECQRGISLMRRRKDSKHKSSDSWANNRLLRVVYYITNSIAVLRRHSSNILKQNISLSRQFYYFLGNCIVVVLSIHSFIHFFSWGEYIFCIIVVLFTYSQYSIFSRFSYQICCFWLNLKIKGVLAINLTLGKSIN